MQKSSRPHHSRSTISVKRAKKSMGLMNKRKSFCNASRNTVIFLAGQGYALIGAISSSHHMVHHRGIVLFVSLGVAETTAGLVLAFDLGRNRTFLKSVADLYSDQTGVI